MKKPIEEPRIYIIVPETVQVPRPRKQQATIRMEAGRLMAQSAHVTGWMRLHQAHLKYDRGQQAGGGPHQAMHYERITTIVLAVRNSRELLKVYQDLMTRSVALNTFSVYSFDDSNPPFYGSTRRIMTAVCTSPVLQAEVDGVIGHLELYS